MKYILVEHSDGPEPKQLTIFDTPEARIKATREAILGPESEDNKDVECFELNILKDQGIVSFEGDPSIEWIDADVKLSPTSQLTK